MLRRSSSADVGPPLPQARIRDGPSARSGLGSREGVGRAELLGDPGLVARLHLRRARRHVRAPLHADAHPRPAAVGRGRRRGSSSLPHLAPGGYCAASGVGALLGRDRRRAAVGGRALGPGRRLVSPRPRVGSFSTSISSRSTGSRSSRTAAFTRGTRSRSGTASSRSSRSSRARTRSSSSSISRRSSRRSPSSSRSRSAGRCSAETWAAGVSAAAQVAMICFAPGMGGAYVFLSLPATASRQLLVPAALALALESVRSPSVGLVASTAAAGLALAVVHPTYAIFLWIPFVGFLVGTCAVGASGRSDRLARARRARRPGRALHAVAPADRERHALGVTRRGRGPARLHAVQRTARRPLADVLQSRARGLHPRRRGRDRGAAPRPGGRLRGAPPLGRIRRRWLRSRCSR